MTEFTLKNLPPNQNFDTVNILKQLARSNRALAELKGYSDTMTNKNILINAMTINEAKDSSAIENIITTHNDIYKSLVKQNNNNPAAKEVISYREAILNGYKLITQKQILSINMIIELQAVIEKNNAGIRKLPGTTLKNEATGEVIYTPPYGEQIIRDYLSNLEKYINDDNFHNIDPLIKLAIIHYQFESIHPFYDGNGRTGRIINILYLVLKGLLDSPILYLSKYILNNRASYYHLLQNIRDTESWEKYILYILIGVEETAKETLDKIRYINRLFNDTVTKIKAEFPKIYSKELVELLFFEFYTKISFIEKGLGVTRKTAALYLSQLETAGIIKSEKIGRDKIYLNVKLYESIQTIGNSVGK
jgi:Fic family protein